MQTNSLSDSMSETNVQIPDVYKYRGICFSKTLQNIYMENKHRFQFYMLQLAHCNSTRYGLQRSKKKMQLKSCRTYLSTLDNVICEDSEFDLSVKEILMEQTEEQFIREQHLTFDKAKKNRLHGRTNIYQPAFRKLLQWLKYEAGLSGCKCPDCEDCVKLLLCPETQAMEQTSVCLNCNCGKHYLAFGSPATPCRVCHVVDPKTGQFRCLGRVQCCKCLRFFPNCRFHRMITMLNDAHDFIEPVRSGRLHLCNFCIVNKSVKREWLQKVQRPFDLGEAKMHRGMRQIMSERKKQKQMLQEMGEATMHAYGADNLLTHRQAARIMRKADDNIDKIVSTIDQSQNHALDSFLSQLGDTINTLSAKGRLDGPKKDLALAATVYHLGKDNVLKVNHRSSTVTVPRKKRQRKS